MRGMTTVAADYYYCCVWISLLSSTQMNPKTTPPKHNNYMNPRMNRLIQPFSKSFLIAALSCVMGTSVYAATYEWAGASTGNINDSTQWTPTATGIPAWNNLFYIETPGAVISQTANINVGQLMIGSASGAPVVFNMTHNVSSNNGTISAGASWNFNTAAGTINHTAGQARPDYNGGALWILVGCATNHYNSGIYNFGGASPGPSIVETGTGTGCGIAIGGGNHNTGVMSLSGYGTITLNDPIYIGTRDCWSDTNGNGTLNITGGNLAINVGAFYAGGHQGSSSILAGGSSATLNVTIDSTGISAINAPIVQIDSLAGLTVSVSGTSPTVGDVYTIINSTNPIVGSFTDQPEGSYVKAGSYWFTISYLSNKVTLTSVDAPTSLPAWVEETFNYTSGAVLAGQNGGTGFSAAWSAVTGNGPTSPCATIVPALTYHGLLCPVGSGAIKTHDWNGNNRALTAPHGSGTYYMSMLVNAQGHETNRLGFGLVESDGGYCQFGRVNGGWGMFAGGQGNFGISSTSGQSYHTWRGVAAAADYNTHLLVFKFNYTAKTIDMFVDPTVGIGTSEPSTPSATLQTGTVDPGNITNVSNPVVSGTWTVNLGVAFTTLEWFNENQNQELGAVRVGKYWQSVVPVVSTDSTLSGLVLSSGTLSPTFAAATHNYTTTVPSASSSITVTPTANDSTATIAVRGTTVASGAASGAIPLTVGYNRINTVVTSPDGFTTTYGVTVTRNSSFTTWISNYPSLTGSNALPGANPAGDGVSNLMKYALGLDPTQVATQVDGFDGYGIYFYVGSDAQNDPTLSFSLEESTDLSNWGPAIYGGTAYSYPPYYYEYDLPTPTVSGAPPKVFGRLKVNQAQ